MASRWPGTGNVRTAACATAALAAGSHSIVARYNGDGANPASTSATLTQTVNAAAGTAPTSRWPAPAPTASASSTFSTRLPGLERHQQRARRRQLGRGTGGWKDATADVWPDWVQVNFNGSKRIDRVVVYSVQNNWTSPVQPTDTMTGSLYVLRNFTVQGWNGSSWVTLATVTGNTLIKRTVTFAQYTTDRIRINVTSTPDGHRADHRSRGVGRRGNGDATTVAWRAR